MKKTLVAMSLFAVLSLTIGLLLLPSKSISVGVQAQQDLRESVCAYGTATNSVRVSALPEECMVGGTLSLAFTVQTGAESFAVDYASDGFAVEGIWQNGNEVKAELAHEAGSAKPVFELLCTFEGEAQISETIYGYAEADKLFLSDASQDDAFEKCAFSLYEDGKLTEGEYEALRSEHYANCVKTEVKTTLSAHRGNAMNGVLATKTYAHGFIVWREGVGEEGNTHPCHDVYVELYDKQAVRDRLLDSMYADGGYFFFSFENDTSSPENGYDIYARIYARGVREAAYPASGNGAYTVDSDVEYDVKTGSDTSLSVIIEMDNDCGRAFQIIQSVIFARKYAEYMSGDTITPVTVRYPAKDTNYDSYYKRINIVNETGQNLSSYESWDVVMHEYGHHVSHEFYIQDSPAGTHWFIDMAEHYQIHAQSTSFKDDCESVPPLKDIKDVSYRLVWDEGFATYFGLVSQNFFVNILNGINTVGDTFYTAYNNLNVDFEAAVGYTGIANEASIVGFLWDLFDDTSEDDDNIELGHQTMWDYIIAAKPTTLDDFLQYLYNNTSVNKGDIGLLLAQYNITASPVVVNTDDYLTIPTFSWTAGGSAHYQHTSYNLHLYDSSHNLLKSYMDLTVTERSTTSTIWSQIMYSEGDQYYVAVEAYQDDGYMKTGPYLYETALDKPNPQSIGVGGSKTITISTSHLYECFMFTAPTTGTYSFYTTGSITTMCSIYSQRFYLTGGNASYLLAEDRGTSGNFNLTLSMTAGQKVFIRVGSRNNSGTCVFSVKRVT